MPKVVKPLSKDDCKKLKYHSTDKAANRKRDGIGLILEARPGNEKVCLYEYKFGKVGNLRKGCGCLCSRKTKYSTQAERTLAERYHAIVQRCRNTGSDYQKNYGARGIENRFSSAEEFVEYMMKHHPHHDYKGVDVDRIDNDGTTNPATSDLPPIRRTCEIGGSSKSHST